MTLKPPDGATNTLVTTESITTDIQNILNIRSLTSFFPDPTSHPADVLTYIHEGLDWTVLYGGWLLIPDSVEPWIVSDSIIPPPNSRMCGPGQVRFNERKGTTHGVGTTTRPVLPNSIGEAWIRLADGANVPILRNDYNDEFGKRGNARGNGAYNQWFCAYGIVFDHNGANQTGALTAIDLRSAWSMNFPYCRLVASRGRGIVLSNCNDCNAEKFSITGLTELISNGTADLNGTTTLLNATGTWVKGDIIFGTGIPNTAYVTNVAGSTLTISAAATLTQVAQPVTEQVQVTDYSLVMEDSTVDSTWIGLSAHSARLAGVLLDSAYGNRIDGLVGYTIGGHNLQLSNTMTGSANYVGGCHGNKINLRLDQATGHNCRIDNGCRDNDVNVVCLSPGIFGTPNDADSGWASIYCDGQDNVLSGTGYESTGPVPNISSVVAYGPNAISNISTVGGGGDLSFGVPLYRYATAAAKYKNMEPGDRYTLAGVQLHPSRTDRIRLYDDFLGDVLADQWNAPTPGTDPQCVVPTIVAGGQNGIVRLTTGDDTGTPTMAVNGVQLDAGLNWRPASFATFEARIRINPGTANVCVYLGFTDQVGTLEMPFTLAAADALTSNASDAVGVLFDTGAATDNWWAVGVKNNADATHQNLGVFPDVNVYETFRVACHSDGSAIFYRNDLLIGSLMSDAVTNTTLLTPVVAVFNRGAATSRTIDIDYISCEQYRV